MALGGGNFTVQNKILPGAYMNFISAANANASLSDRGIATIALEMDWCVENRMFTVEQADFIKNSVKIFGYPYNADELKPMREIFAHAKTVHFFRLNASGVKATCKFGTAKYAGTRGNRLNVAIEANENTTTDTPLYNIGIYLDTAQVFYQTAVGAMTDLAKNEFVEWDTSAAITVTASTPLTGGTNGTVADAAYQTYLDQAEAYSFNAMGCMSENDTVKKLFAAYVKRMREEVGKKFQVVVHTHSADREDMLSVKNNLTDGTVGTALIPWVTGVAAGTAVNKSATNMVYDGEYEIDTIYTQAQLEEALSEGSFVFHNSNGKTVVLEDINTFVSVTAEKSADFSSNQTIRVLDQIANEVAVLFVDKYLGEVPNDADGRISFWKDVVAIHTELQRIRAIEKFSSDHVSVEQGDSKKSVVLSETVTPVNAMAQLYATVRVN